MKRAVFSIFCVKLSDLYRNEEDEVSMSGIERQNLGGMSVLITGASSGIGAEIAHSLAREGARLALMARNEAKLKEVADSLPEDADVTIIPGDVTSEEDVRNAVEQTVVEFGSLDILVNNAGFGSFRPIHEMPVEEFDSIVAVNLRGVFLCTRLALQTMYEQGKGGAIVTISSLAGKRGFPGGGGYCAAKFGVMGLMESVFLEARSHDVRVITLTPGSVDTPFFDDVEMKPNREKILQPEDVAETVVYALNLPKRALIRELDIRPANPK